jgi:hypothetical protein
LNGGEVEQGPGGALCRRRQRGSGEEQRGCRGRRRGKEIRDRFAKSEKFRVLLVN